MKKLAVAVAATVVAFTSQATDFVSVDIDRVKDTTTKQISTAEYVRAGKDIAGLQFGIQQRTGIYQNGGGTFTSLETTVGKSLGPIMPYVGYGYDNGLSGKPATKYDYGIIGANAGMPVGIGYALAGIKTRVNWTDTNPKQTVAWGTYSVPVAKSVYVNLNVSKSYQTITENAYGLGIGLKF